MPVRLSVYLLPEQWAIVSEVLNARSDYYLENAKAYQSNDKKFVELIAKHDAIEEITTSINAVIDPPPSSFV
jgi:hypothetical protein